MTHKFEVLTWNTSGVLATNLETNEVRFFTYQEAGMGDGNKFLETGQPWSFETEAEGEFVAHMSEVERGNQQPAA